MTDKEDLKTADAVVATSTGTSAVAVGAPLVPVKMAAAAVGGKGVLIAAAAKSTVIMGVAATAAPVVFAGAAVYGLWRVFSD